GLYISYYTMHNVYLQHVTAIMYAIGVHDPGLHPHPVDAAACALEQVGQHEGGGQRHEEHRHDPDPTQLHPSITPRAHSAESGIGPVGVATSVHGPLPVASATARSPGGIRVRTSSITSMFRR